MTLTDHNKATGDVLERIHNVRQALDQSRNDGFDGQGLFLRPDFQLATLRLARDELDKAIRTIEQIENQTNRSGQHF